MVIATGGFQANRKLVTQYIGKGAHRLVLRGYKEEHGRRAQDSRETGSSSHWHGRLPRWDHPLRLQEISQGGRSKGDEECQKYEPGILVNRQGKRFVDEGEDTADKTYAKFGRIIALTQPGGIAYLIFDSTAKDGNRSDV